MAHVNRFVIFNTCRLFFCI